MGDYNKKPYKFFLAFTIFFPKRLPICTFFTMYVERNLRILQMFRSFLSLVLTLSIKFSFNRVCIIYYVYLYVQWYGEVLGDSMLHLDPIYIYVLEHIWPYWCILSYDYYVSYIQHIWIIIILKWVYISHEHVLLSPKDCYEFIQEKYLC